LACELSHTRRYWHGPTLKECHEQGAAMNLARGSHYDDGTRQREPVDSPSVSTAVQITAAWLIAFTCVALLTLLS